MERIGERTALRPTKTFYCDGIRKLVDNWTESIEKYDNHVEK
jgi:hypothetical protein